jgi:hypothetical protein
MRVEILTKMRKMKKSLQVENKRRKNDLEIIMLFELIFKPLYDITVISKILMKRNKYK